MVCGIAEAGRGALAGPLCIAGVVLLQRVSDSNDYDEIDSKSLCRVVFKSASFIDRHGLSRAIKDGMEEVINSIKADVYIKNIGSNFGIDTIKTLKVGEDMPDEIKVALSLAKSSRNNYMLNLANRYPFFAFDEHRGYRTDKHKSEIEKYGIMGEHRRSFCYN